MEERKWIVVTGSAGFIGSTIIRELNLRGYSDQIIAVDDFKESPKWKNLIGTKYNEFISRFELFPWFEREKKRVKAVIHMGANSSTVGKDGDDYYKTNYRYSIELAKRALEENIRLIYASSAATYGLGLNGFRDAVEELDLLQPLNLYGYSKHMFDLWALRNECLDEMVGLKYFNVYGPNEAHKGRMASMVYHMFHQIKEKGKVFLFSSNTKEFSDGEQKRDFIHVKDVARMTVDFLFNDITGIFNIGTGKARSWNDLAKAVFSAYEKPLKIEYIPMPQDIAKTYQNFTEADMTRLHNLGIQSEIDLEEGVFDYVSNNLIPKELCLTQQ